MSIAVVKRGSISNRGAVPYFLIGVLGFAALFFGGVHVWSRAVAMLAIFGAFLWIFWNASRMGVFPGAFRNASVPASGQEKGSVLEPVTAMGLFLLAWGARCN